MSEFDRERIKMLISEIKQLDSKLKALIAKGKIQREPYLNESKLEHRPPGYWRILILSQSLVRLRHIIENNISRIETLGTLALTRYIFELVVWLKLFEKDENYVFLFAWMYFDGQIDFYTKLEKFNNREVELYESFAREEDEQNKNEIDAKLERDLLIYDDEVREMGYRSQAERIRTQVLPEIKELVRLNQKSFDNFNEKRGALVATLKKNMKNTRWVTMAKEAGMEIEFDFIYSYTSRLLHAKPVSIITNQQELMDSELLLFWRFIRNQFRWIVTNVENEFSRTLEGETIC